VLTVGMVWDFSHDVGGSGELGDQTCQLDSQQHTVFQRCFSTSLTLIKTTKILQKSADFSRRSVGVFLQYVVWTFHRHRQTIHVFGLSSSSDTTLSRMSPILSFSHQFTPKRYSIKIRRQIRNRDQRLQYLVCGIIATRIEAELGKGPQCDTNRFLAVGRGSEVKEDGRTDNSVSPDKRSFLLTNLFRRRQPTERYCLSVGSENQGLEKGNRPLEKWTYRGKGTHRRSKESSIMHKRRQNY